jgi:phosphoribosylaminoimidazolecarboxamide formyltransferase / IMP cyclohydrolase
MSTPRRTEASAGIGPEPGVSPRALVSVSDKRGLQELAQGLVQRGWELVSTGGTARAIREAGLPVTDVAAVTGAPEMLDGRVKTLHPRIAAGVLADLRLEAHRQQMAEQGIDPFGLVIVNLYRFEQAAQRPGVTDDELIEEIDIGGPTLVRAAAKNHASVGIVVDPEDYPAILAELDVQGQLTEETRRALALKAFRLTALYDATIAASLGGRWQPQDRLPTSLALGLRRAQVLRYGENPHQAAALYVMTGRDPADGPFARGASLLAGKELSYNNLLDAAAAAALARDLQGAAVAIVKHGNPCGAAEAADLPTAWERALAGDPVSAYGGVVAVRGTVDASLAAALAGQFLEVIIAATFDGAARRSLSDRRRDLRLVEDPSILSAAPAILEVRSAGGALLVSDADVAPDDPGTWRTASAREPDPRERADLAFAWRVVRHVKSNAIVLARDGAIVGVGAGQMNRLTSARLAVAQAAERAKGAVVASDAFFPFADGAEACLAAGATALIQPGGSKHDAEVLAAVDAAGAAMVVTGRRHFRH